MDDRLRVYKILNATEISYILGFLDIDETLLLFKEMTPRYIVNIIESFDIDDAVDIMQALPDEERAGYLKLMTEKHREEIKTLFQHKEDTAGSIMTTQYIELAENYNDWLYFYYTKGAYPF